LPKPAQHDTLTGRHEVGDEGLVVLGQDLRSGRDLEHDRVAGAAALVLALAVMATLGAEMLLIAIIDQRVQIGLGLDHDVAAATSVAAIGPAIFDEFFAPEAKAAGATVTGLRVDLALIEEFHVRARVADGRGPKRERGNGAGRPPGLVACAYEGTVIPPPPAPVAPTRTCGCPRGGRTSRCH
jgi:hypothetical protein